MSTGKPRTLSVKHQPARFSVRRTKPSVVDGKEGNALTNGLQGLTPNSHLEEVFVGEFSPAHSCHHAFLQSPCSCVAIDGKAATDSRPPAATHFPSLSARTIRSFVSLRAELLKSTARLTEAAVIISNLPNFMKDMRKREEEENFEMEARSWWCYALGSGLRPPDCCLGHTLYIPQRFQLSSVCPGLTQETSSQSK